MMLKHGLLILCVLVLASTALSVSADQAKILVIKTSDNTFFNTTIEHLINNTHSQAKFTIRSLQSLRENPFEELSAQVIVTLGYQAAKYSIDLDSSIPVIHSYLTEFQHRSLSRRPNHSSLLLEQPLVRYAEFIKHLLPVKRIGLLKTEANRIASSTLTDIEQRLNLSVDQVIYSADDNPVNAVRKLLEKNDALLTLPDPEIYNRQSLKGILLTSYRLNKPMISYSPAHVKSGALAAIYTSPENIGKQLAGIVDQQLQPGVSRLEPFYYATEFNISINKQVARSLGLKIPDQQQLLQQIGGDGQ